MSAIASQITSLTIVYSTVFQGADHRKHQSSASLAFVRGIHRAPVNSPHKGPVTRTMFPFDDVIMWTHVSTNLMGSDSHDFLLRYFRFHSNFREMLIIHFNQVFVKCIKSLQRVCDSVKFIPAFVAHGVTKIILVQRTMQPYIYIYIYTNGSKSHVTFLDNHWFHADCKSAIIRPYRESDTTLWYTVRCDVHGITWEHDIYIYIYA